MGGHPPARAGAAAVAAGPERPTTAHPRWQRWLDWLFPPRCAGCRRRGHWLCEPCRSRLEPVPPPHCPRCGNSVLRAGLCRSCQQSPPAFDRVWALYQHEGAIRVAVHRFKYKGERGFAAPLGALLAAGLPATGFAADLVVPVPLHPSRERQRGYNQSAELARVVAVAIDRPLTTDLRRHRPTPPQVGRGLDERRRNVAGAFSWHGSELSSQRVLLIDDVCTTGATLDACARALRAHAPAAIVALTLTRG
jgi:ComF family protein